MSTPRFKQFGGAVCKIHQDMHELSSIHHLFAVIIIQCCGHSLHYTCHSPPLFNKYVVIFVNFSPTGNMLICRCIYGMQVCSTNPFLIPLIIPLPSASLPFSRIIQTYVYIYRWLMTRSHRSDLAAVCGSKITVKPFPTPIHFLCFRRLRYTLFNLYIVCCLGTQYAADFSFGFR